MPTILVLMRWMPIIQVLKVLLATTPLTLVSYLTTPTTNVITTISTDRGWDWEIKIIGYLFN